MATLGFIALSCQWRSSVGTWLAHSRCSLKCQCPGSSAWDALSLGGGINSNSKMGMGEPGPKPRPLTTASVYSPLARLEERQQGGKGAPVGLRKGAQERRLLGEGYHLLQQGPLAFRRVPRTLLRYQGRASEAVQSPAYTDQSLWPLHPLCLHLWKGHFKLLRPRPLPLSA